MYDSSDYSSAYEEGDSLPPPVTEETPFEFDRIQRRLADILEYPKPETITYFDDESEKMVMYTIEIRYGTYSSMRKMIHSWGDVTYRYRPLSSADIFWDGVETGVCESCQHVSGRNHPIWYKKSERTYHEIDYGCKAHYLKSIPDLRQAHHLSNVVYHINNLESLSHFMRHNALPGTLGQATARHQLHVDVMMDIHDKDIVHLVEILSYHGVELACSIKLMNLKERVMRDIFTMCICGKNTREARVWKINAPYAQRYTTKSYADEPMIIITPPARTEEMVRQRLVTTDGEVARDWSMRSEVRLVQQACLCLCACGHRNTNYMVAGTF